MQNREELDIFLQNITNINYYIVPFVKIKVLKLAIYSEKQTKLYKNTHPSRVSSLVKQ